MKTIAVTLKPIMSEKAYGLSKKLGVYVFEVPSDLNKLQILNAVRDQFKVNPTNVNVSNQKDSPKRTVKRRGKVIKGVKSGTKRAYVTLKKGEAIPVYAAIDEAEAKAQKAEAKAAAAAKKSESSKSSTAKESKK